MARELSGVVNLKPLEVATDESELRQAAERLDSAGYPLRGDADFSAMAQLRTAYRSCVEALAQHLGKPSTPLVRQD